MVMVEGMNQNSADGVDNDYYNVMIQSMCTRTYTDTFSYNCALVTALANLDQHSIKHLFIMKILRAQLHQINLPYHYLFDVLWCLCADSKNSYKEQSFYNFLLILSFWGSRIPTAIS